MAQPNKALQGVLLVILILGGLAALVATFFLAGEDHLPGSFYIDRQAMWGDGRYYVKFTFLMTLLTLADVVAVPLILFAGLRAMVSSEPRPGAMDAPLGWDTVQLGRRVKQVLFILVGGGLWFAFTALAILAPEKLSPIGFLASLLLLSIPLMPMILPVVLFDALLAPQYVEGPIEALQIVVNKSTRTAHLQVAGATHQVSAELADGLAQGMTVGLIVSGFLDSVLRLEKRR